MLRKDVPTIKISEFLGPGMGKREEERKLFLQNAKKQFDVAAMTYPPLYSLIKKHEVL